MYPHLPPEAAALLLLVGPFKTHSKSFDSPDLSSSRPPRSPTTGLLSEGWRRSFGLQLKKHFEAGQTVKRFKGGLPSKRHLKTGFMA